VAADDIIVHVGLWAEELLPRPAGYTGDEQEQLHNK
jgi:hypothetical protein